MDGRDKHSQCGHIWKTDNSGSPLAFINVYSCTSSFIITEREREREREREPPPETGGDSTQVDSTSWYIVSISKCVEHAEVYLLHALLVCYHAHIRRWNDAHESKRKLVKTTNKNSFCWGVQTGIDIHNVAKTMFSGGLCAQAMSTVTQVHSIQQQQW